MIKWSWIDMENGHKWSSKVLENARKKVMENHFQFLYAPLISLSGSQRAGDLVVNKAVGCCYFPSGP